MTTESRCLLEAFDRLSGEERCKVAFEILSRVGDLAHPPLTDEDLARIAAETYPERDAHAATEVPA